MPRFQYPRARGGDGRGPQVGPGTFEARSKSVITDQPAGMPPEQFEGIVWSPGNAFPDTELWCIHVGQGYFHKVRGTPGSSTSLTLAKVAAAQEFVPPPNAPADSPATVNALRAYARDRYALLYFETDLDEWVVQVATPAPTAVNSPTEKVEDGVYSVSQPDRATGFTPLAWLNVFDDGRQELWLFWHPNELDGFHVPGTTPAGAQAPYDATELRFDATHPTPLLQHAATLADRVTAMRLIAAGEADSPVLDILELVVHHFRVRRT